MEIADDIEMTSEEVISDDKMGLKDVVVESAGSTVLEPEHEAPLDVPKQQEVITSSEAATTSKSIRPAPAPYTGISGNAGTKSRGETRFGRKGKRRIDSSQGTSATKKSKG